MKFVHVVCIWVTLAATFAAGQNPVPIVNQPLVPMTVAPGGSTFTLTVNGNGFVSGATVNWNGTGLVTTFVSESQLTATVPASDIATASTGSVTATNPTPGGGTSNVQYVSVAEPTAPIVFAPAVNYGSGGLYPESLAVADVNGDGKPDLLVVNVSACDCLGVLLGNGDGTFQPAVTYGVGGLGGGPVAVADLNGDGKPDLVVTLEGGVSVLLGNGDGTFQTAVLYESGGYITAWAAVADLNGDGKLDLVVANECTDPNCDGASVGVLLGNGDGTFQTAVTYDSGAHQANSVAVADVNGDGKPDLLVANGYNMLGIGQVGVLLGNGDGTFQTAVTYGTAGYRAGPMVVADVNGDGKPDLLVVNSNVLGVLLGNGDGTFQPAAHYFMGGVEPGSIAVEDINGDGKLDVLVANDGYYMEAVLLGNGDGTFQTASVLNFGGTGQVSATLADLNGDGKPDLVVNGCTDTSCDDDMVGVLINSSQHGPAIALSPTSLSFGYQMVGTASAPQIVTLTNVGSTALTIVSIGVGGTDSGDFAQTNNCPGSVAPNGNCRISVTFTPTAGGSRSAALSISDNAPGSPQSVPLSGSVRNFTVAANSPTSQTVTQGQAANFTVTVSPLNGFAGTVSLHCSGAPAQSTCTVTPSSVALSGTDAMIVNVAAVTAGASMAGTQPIGVPSNGSGLAAWVALAGMLGLGLIVALPNRRPHLRWAYGLAFLCLLSIGVMLPACGGGGGSSSSTGTPTGTYTLTVTGAYPPGSSTLTHATKLTLVVQ